MQIDAKEPLLIETNFTIAQVLDGDSLIVEHFFTREKKEIRLYGLDAPETKRNRKLMEDEKKTRLAGEFLIKLGLKATAFLLTVAPPGTNVTLITEEKYYYDFYKRQLAYLILPDGSCLNELLVKEGYAKPMSEYYCSLLPTYQKIGFEARRNGKGLYEFTPIF